MQIVRYAWREERKTNRTHFTAGSLHSFPQGNWSSTASSGQANDQRESETCCSGTILKLENGIDPMVTLGEPLKHVIALRGPFLVSRTGVDPSSFASVCRFKTPPCVHSKRPCVPAPRPQVFQHVRVVPAHTGGFWMYTRSSSPCHTIHATHATHTTTTTTTIQHHVPLTHNYNKNTTQHNLTQRQTQRDRDGRRRR